MIDALPFLMFAALMPLLFSGFPVAFVLGGVGLVFWLIAAGLGLVTPESFYLVISRIFGGVIQKPLLVAIPMFILMGTILEKSGVARDLLAMLNQLTRRVPGGLAISVTLLGVILAATTGIIGASVVMMTLLAMPAMLDAGYKPSLASGTIAASGTLGILLPPSIMLVVMADLLATSAGTLFLAATIPALLLALLYCVAIFGFVLIRPDNAPTLNAPAPDTVGLWQAVRAIVPPVALITAVLGSIFAGYATPTEASAIGAFGAILVAALHGRLSLRVLRSAGEQTALTTTMIFGLFLGATAFSFVFTLLGGHDLILEALDASGAHPWLVLAVLMAVIFALGFFFDWIEITLIILPVFGPVVAALDFGGHVGGADIITWFAVMMAVNLQTSFLTPPFGFALFYLKGAADARISLTHIYRGVIPFVGLQLLVLFALALWPEIALWLPRVLG